MAGTPAKAAFLSGASSGSWLIALLVWLILLAIMIFVLLLAWNRVMPKVFGLPKIDFWDSLALILIVWVLLSFACSTRYFMM